MENKTYSSSKGVVIVLKPVSQFKINSLRESQLELPVPVYVSRNVAGEEQEVPLDETIAKNKGRLDEWNEYQKAKNLQDAANAKKFTEMLVWEGTEVEVPDEASDWQKACEHFGFVVPANPVSRKLFYVYNELLGTPDDIGGLVSEILSVSQIDEEAVGKLRKSFRSPIPRPGDKRMSKTKKPMEHKQPDVQ